MSVVKSKKIYFVVLTLCIILLSLVIIRNITNSTLITESIEVEQNSELIYYLDISYDGIDKNGTESDDTQTSELRSSYINVEDKLPNGLVFKGFVESEDGTYGAIKRYDGSACPGEIIDDSNGADQPNNFHGLHYNESTRMITFKVRSLGAGCKLTIGIIAETPSLGSLKRMDFYNTATAQEGEQSITSNTVHVWIGSDEVDLYEVEYQYAGEVPEGAPKLPETSSYAQGTSVGVEKNPVLEGYTFSGWSASGASISNNSFTMPAGKVTLTGSFTKKTPYKVTYQIEGDIPDGYVLPGEKEYYPDSVVELDILDKGDIIDGYRFLGWTAEGVEVSEYRDFIMPSKNVTVKGKFELVTYKVEYKFYDSVLPPNHEELLPTTKEYQPGEIVTLEQPKEVEGYTFLGWYKEDNFEMPEEDIVIYGEWAQISWFDLGIKKSIISEPTHYKPGDIVKYKIVVSNPNNFDVTNVQVQENKKGAYFTETILYKLITDNVAEIPIISANGSVTLYAEYKVGNESSKYISSEVEIVGASSSGENEFNIMKEFKSAATFKIYSKLNVCKVIDTKTNSSYAFHITGEGYDSWLNVGANSCSKIYIPDGEYEISELVPQTNDLVSIELSDSLNGNADGEKAIFTIGEPLENEITFTNKYKKQGFYKSNGEIKNAIPSVCEIFPLTGEIACLDNIKSPNVSSSVGIDFQKISSDTNGKGVYIYAGTENKENPIYYYRGAVNNNIIFADFCWKIVRTTDTGGIMLIYNGPVGSGNICNNTGTATQLTTMSFNTSNNRAPYVGYTYGSATELRGTTNSTIKTYIDNWYKANILDRGFSTYLEDTVYCVDRTSMISGSTTYYGAYIRIRNSDKPIITCPIASDAYTVSTANGNGILTYPVALLTLDEIILGGVAWKYSNSTTYLYTGQMYWTISPSAYAPSGSYVFIILSNGDFANDTVLYSPPGVRPSISLAPGTILTPVGNSGRVGTAENPYLAVRRAE